MIIHEDRYLYYSRIDRLLSQIVWTNDVTQAHMFTNMDVAEDTQTVIDAALYDESDEGPVPPSNVSYVINAKITIEHG